LSYSPEEKSGKFIC